MNDILMECANLAKEFEGLHDLRDERIIMKITEHFTFEELTNSSSHPELVEQNRLDAQPVLKQLKYTAGTLEELRTVIGEPLLISSGFRNEALNKVVGGSSTSKHKLGLCADFIPNSKAVNEAFKLIIENRDKCPSLRKCIIEGVKGKTWLHIQAKVDSSEPTTFFKTDDGINYTEIKA